MRKFLSNTLLYKALKKLCIFLLHWISVIKIKLSLTKASRLNLGSGPLKSLNDLTNVDYYGSDINLDLTKKLPFKDESIEYIYSSHFLEHLDYKNIIKVLKECNRVLKKDSQLSICVPNFKLYLEAYSNSKVFKSYETMHPGGAVNTNSKIDQLNYIAYLGGDHQYMFDEENLINMLKQAGFIDPCLREYDEKVDKYGRDYESLYALAKK